MTVIVLVGLCAAGGAWAAGKIGAPFAGGLIGGLVGLFAGFAAVYVRYRDL